MVSSPAWGRVRLFAVRASRCRLPAHRKPAPRRGRRSDCRSSARRMPYRARRRRAYTPPVGARSMLIGRRAEGARLDAALERARLGQGSLVLLSGEAGVGKTRLASEVAAESEALVLLGASSQGGTPSYGPVVAALRSFLR